jgi:hypothetical protein
MNTLTEPSITVNGARLTTAQAMTVRVALGAFTIALADGLGDDHTGTAICAGYLRCIDEINRLMGDPITGRSRE